MKNFARNYLNRDRITNTIPMIDVNVNDYTKINDYTKSMLNILEDFSDENEQLEQTQRTFINIIEDFAQEKTRLEETQRAAINILEDFTFEKYRLENTQKAVLNILEDIDVEYKKTEIANKDLKISEERLRSTAEKLKESNEELEQFAYIASHDLREPLRTISGFIGLIFNRYKTQLEPDQELLNYIIDASKRMQEMIDDLLQLSRISKGKIFQDVDIKEVINNILKNLNKLINQNFAKIIIDEMPHIKGDPNQIEQLFQNLIENAIKFRKPNISPEIRIHADKQIEEDSSQWIFSIQDNGIGIDPKDFKKLFIIFQRLHSRYEYNGTGIGLALCKKIVERHGGKIWVESTPDVGSTFYFSIPE
jgi:light-regulated signal transduction histidine kinase (bacteriophytochrome)